MQKIVKHPYFDFLSAISPNPEMILLSLFFHSVDNLLYFNNFPAFCINCGWISTIYCAKVPPNSAFKLKNNTLCISFQFCELTSWSCQFPFWLSKMLLENCNVYFIICLLYCPNLPIWHVRGLKKWWKASF